MALFEEMQRTQLLLDDLGFAVFNDADIVRYVNMARGQIAGQSGCIRVMGTLAVTGASQVYLFSTISLGGASGVQGVLHVRQVTYQVASGALFVHPRSFPYFNLYYLANAAPQPSPPAAWSQFGQGASGSLYVNKLDAGYTLNVDTVCYPSALALDSDPEAIPYMWTDAIPFLAAYYAALSKKDDEGAKRMMDAYNDFMNKARAGANPSVMPYLFEHSGDPFMNNRLGIQAGR